MYTCSVRVCASDVGQRVPLPCTTAGANAARVSLLCPDCVGMPANSARWYSGTQLHPKQGVSHLQQQQQQHTHTHHTTTAAATTTTAIPVLGTSVGHHGAHVTWAFIYANGIVNSRPRLYVYGMLSQLCNHVWDTPTPMRECIHALCVAEMRIHRTANTHKHARTHTQTHARTHSMHYAKCRGSCTGHGSCMVRAPNG